MHYAGPFFLALQGIEKIFFHCLFVVISLNVLELFPIFRVMEIDSI